MKANDRGNDEVIWVHLNAEDAARKLRGDFDGFEIFQRPGTDSQPKPPPRPFTLHQFIGNPGVVKLSKYSGSVLSCAGEHKNATSVIAGLTYDATHSGAMHDLHLECLPLPQRSRTAQQADIAKLCARAPLPIGSLSQPFPTGRCVRLRGLKPFKWTSKTAAFARVGKSVVYLILDKPAKPQSINAGIGRVVGSTSYNPPGGSSRNVPKIRVLRR